MILYKTSEIRNQSNYEYLNKNSIISFRPVLICPLQLIACIYGFVVVVGLVKFLLLLCLHIRLQSAFTSLNHSSVTECTLAPVHRLKMLFSFQNPSLDNATLSLYFTTPTVNINRK